MNIVYAYIYVCMYIYIYRHVFRTSQGSSVWLALTSREQLMSQECSKHQVLSFAKILVANEKRYFVLISVLHVHKFIT